MWPAFAEKYVIPRYIICPGFFLPLPVDVIRSHITLCLLALQTEMKAPYLGMSYLILVE